MPANNSLIVQVRRGTTAQTASYTGPLAELIVDTDQKTISVQDGVTSGGIYLARQDFTQAAFNAANSAGSSTFTQSAFDKANSANVLAQAAYDTANAAGSSVYTQAAYTQANLATVIAQSAYNQANSEPIALSAYNQANLVGSFAQAAYNQANSEPIGTGAFTRANSANALANAAFNAANTKFNSTGGTISGSVLIQQNLTVEGNVSYTGNVISYQVTGNTGQFFGYSSNGFNALYAGIPTGYLIQPQTITQFTANFDGYAGVNHQNINSGANSSSDIFLTADNGTFLDGFVDIGIASSSYNYPGYSLLGPNDGYFNVTGNTTTGGGNMVLSTGLSHDIIFAVGGTSIGNDVMRVSALSNNILMYSNVSSKNTTTGTLVVTGGVGISGNVYASRIYDNGIELRDYANNISSLAQSSFNQANSANVLAQAAFNQANSSNVLAQSSYNFSNTVNVFTQSAYNQANSEPIGTAAFNQANSANVLAQAAFNAANNAGGGSTVMAQAAFDRANSANVLAQSSYNQANSANVLAQSSYNQANSANVLAQAAFNAANTGSSALAQSAFNQANSAYSQANSATVIAQAAFNKANTANGGGGSGLDTTLVVSTNYTLSTNANFILASNTITITLPDAVGNIGYKYNIKNVGNGTITILGQSNQTIDNNTDMVMSYQYSVMGVLSNGSNWSIF
jgi:hypothetical protein